MILLTPITPYRSIPLKYLAVKESVVRKLEDQTDVRQSPGRIPLDPYAFGTGIYPSDVRP